MKIFIGQLKLDYPIFTLRKYVTQLLAIHGPCYNILTYSSRLKSRLLSAKITVETTKAKPHFFLINLIMLPALKITQHFYIFRSIELRTTQIGSKRGP